jgi:hypothetical protein
LAVRVPMRPTASFSAAWAVARSTTWVAAWRMSWVAR